MQGCGNDYIFFDNRDGKITSPESLCVSLCDRHYGIGGYGIVLIEDSDIADAKMRIFNRDGTEGKMAGNSIRCVGKYLYDKGIVKKEYMTIETAVGVKSLLLYIRNGKANTISVGMGKADLDTKSLPTTLPGSTIINRPVDIADGTYNITCASVGNPHCVVFCDDPSSLDLEKLGPKFEHAAYFPERINTEFVRVVNRRHPADARLRAGQRRDRGLRHRRLRRRHRRHRERLRGKGQGHHRQAGRRRPGGQLFGPRSHPDRRRRDGV